MNWARDAMLTTILSSCGVVGAMAQTPPTSPPATAVPSINRVNQQLPSWLRVRGEFRERVEGVQGAGFVEGRNDGYLLSRIRLQATAQPGPLYRVVVQAQDARVANKTIGPTTAPFRDNLDLRLAYLEIGTAASRALVRVGRQELVYGDQRLIGHVSWLNGARTFDAATVTLRSKKVSLDLFGASVVVLRDRAFNKSDFGASRLVGAYATTGALVPKATVEPFVLYRVAQQQLAESGLRGDLRAATIGVRMVGALPARLDYNTEMAFQTGSLLTDEVRAWAGHWTLRRTVTKQYVVKVVGELNYASGDADPRDGVRGTFDQLYPTGHDKYGLADQVGWRNVQHVRAGIELTPRKGLSLSSSYHTFWLANRHDALYNAAGVSVARVVGGAVRRHIGHEFDVQAVWVISPVLQLSGGYARLVPAAFVKEATRGASFGAPYVMATYVLFADQ